MITFRDKAKFDKAGTILLISKKQIEKNQFNFQNASVKKTIQKLKKAGILKAEKGQSFPVPLSKGIALICVVDETANLTSLRIAIKNAVSSPHFKTISTIEIIPHQVDDALILALIDGLLIGQYAWKKYISSDKNTPVEKTYFLSVKKKPLFDNAVKICDGVNFARDLINENADITDAIFMEKTIRQMTKGIKNIELEILGQAEMEKKGLGFHLAVNQGSTKDPRLIIIKYTGADVKEPYTALVGKGLTFDSGGMNLKPSGHMETMRTDMSGAAAVVGTLKNVLALKPKKNIVFVCAMAENAIGPKSYKPGDVIKGYAGKTVEIGNTDAEGRLVLADALAYTIKNYKPKQIIDVATLTGACVVALGFDYSGLLSTDDKFADALLAAANETDDRAWRLPIYEEIREHMKSKIADLRNISNIKGAGTITGAEFLRQFVGETSWAHLDIAGTSYVENASHWYYNHGATGAGVRLLTRFLLNSLFSD